MSHFVTIVLVDGEVDREDAEAAIEPLLAPYDENMDVEPYGKDCWCKGRDAADEVNAQVRAEFEDRFEALREQGRQYIEERRKREPEWEAPMLGPPTKELDDAWNLLQREVDARRQELLDAHPRRNEANPLCGWHRYEALGLESRDASIEVIEEAYRRARAEAEAAYEKAMTDEDGPPLPSLRGNNEKRRLEYLDECREILTDPVKRADYDAEGDGEGCKGTGIEESTYNPKSKWDWYVIGGRWTGMLAEDYDPDLDPRNFGPCAFCSPGVNSAMRVLIEASGEPSPPINPTGKVKQYETGTWGAAAADDPEAKDCHVCNGTKIERKFRNAPIDGDVVPASHWLKLLNDPEKERGHFIPYAILTPDGEWHQRGEMGWFGMTSDEKLHDEWETEVLRLAEQHRDCTAVVTDLHI